MERLVVAKSRNRAFILRCWVVVNVHPATIYSLTTCNLPCFSLPRVSKMAHYPSVILELYFQRDVQEVNIEPHIERPEAEPKDGCQKSPDCGLPNLFHSAM